MKQPYASVNQPYVMLILASAQHKTSGMQIMHTH